MPSAPRGPGSRDRAGRDRATRRRAGQRLGTARPRCPRCGCAGWPNGVCARVPRCCSRSATTGGCPWSHPSPAMHACASWSTGIRRPTRASAPPSGPRRGQSRAAVQRARLPCPDRTQRLAHRTARPGHAGSAAGRLAGRRGGDRARTRRCARRLGPAAARARRGGALPAERRAHRSHRLASALSASRPPALRSTGPPLAVRKPA